MGASKSEEYSEAVQGVVNNYFEKFDLNKDGIITQDEMMECHRRDWGDDFQSNYDKIKSCA